ncbi:hypothetical protein ACFLVB_03965 [Chloroflexota bacterium]
MPKKENIEKSVNLSDKIFGLSDDGQKTFKERITRAARGDDLALGQIIISSYGYRNNETINEILSLILPD